MEFLRFGSSIPGSYWGCCAMDIIQNFKVEPSAPYAISLVDGDGGHALTHPAGGSKFVGMTYHEVFKARIRFGTFSDREMPSHGFLAVLTESQVNGGVGKKWLAILREEGFEFIRTVDNSGYTGANVITAPKSSGGSPHKNYIFGLFRNIGTSPVPDQFTPPKAWTDLQRVNDAPEMWELAAAASQATKALTLQAQADQLKVWNKGNAPKFYSRAEVEAACPGNVWLAGERSPKPQRKAEPVKATKASAFPTANKA